MRMDSRLRGNDKAPLRDSASRGHETVIPAQAGIQSRALQLRTKHSKFETPGAVCVRLEFIKKAPISESMLESMRNSAYSYF
jgi:hypothetical protein